ncbi:hypothetical protein L1887_25371 [Cichorium endivia]|nr:hypothetical protein L1887_25371 [Cichorium endivia]
MFNVTVVLLVLSVDTYAFPPFFGRTPFSEVHRRCTLPVSLSKSFPPIASSKPSQPWTSLVHTSSSPIVR